ncbi:tetratricopeptide repeat-containing diguanylate cyclase [Psychrobacillus sp. OK032]|uniref:tetratricopeptide repeat-containing diguanylate cyclase n=1 Tax=Psychrobacillus sp. OK032 TaxID=1884358 RepID=UPI0008D80928|nr:tetratricopeptide repeat-containing diguanylate cyclase [Psychrobacillus sp. OK032]SER97623.1 diguanylate cyclase (GGDEF) domain-containing protein [Psychrobacillus sp. OK032]
MKEVLSSLQAEVTQLRAEGEYQVTIERANELLDIGIICNDYKSILIAHINQAASYYSIGDIEEAFVSMERYEEITLAHGDDADYLQLYNVMFLLYEFNKQYDYAKETLNKSMQLAKQLKRYNILSNAYSNYSHVCIQLGDYEEALEEAKKGLAAAKQHEPNSAVLEVRVMFNIAHAYICLNLLEDAKLVMDEMEKKDVFDSYIRERAQFQMLTGDWLNQKKAYRESFEAYSSAKEIVDTYQDVYLLKTIQEKRLKISEIMEDIHLSYQVQKEYIQLLQTINERELAFKAIKLNVKHQLSKIQKKAELDYLTGLYNRSYLIELVTSWFGEASDTYTPISCIAFDLDGFKAINDVYGHLMGDEVIREVGILCKNALSPEFIIGRYGGDEFVIIGRNSLEETLRLANVLKETIAGMKLVKNEKSIQLAASFGISSTEDESINSFDELFHLADMRLYNAKQNGKNQVFAGNHR